MNTYAIAGTTVAGVTLGMTTFAMLVSVWLALPVVLAGFAACWLIADAEEEAITEAMETAEWQLETIEWVISDEE